MKIELSKIKPSPNPIRKTWDEEKMKELTWSLMEEGQVEPIGVTENGGDYIIVWGHRRVEAAKRANWKEIEASVVTKDEVNNLIQSGIENLSGEEMTDEEKVDWAYRLVQLGLNQSEIARRSSLNQSTLNHWLMYKSEKDSGVSMNVHSQSTGGDGIMKTVVIKQVLGDDIEAKKAVANKTSTDRLNRDQTRAVAEAYRDAPTPAVKAAVLKAPIISRDTAADILRRSVNKVELEGGIASIHEMNEWDKEREEKRLYDGFEFPVKEFLDAVKLFKVAADRGAGLVMAGRYSHEAAQYTIRKIDALMDALKNYREALEGVK